jgi:uncharacterized protein (DUF2342 family)
LLLLLLQKYLVCAVYLHQGCGAAVGLLQYESACQLFTAVGSEASHQVNFHHNIWLSLA